MDGGCLRLWSYGHGCDGQIQQPAPYVSGENDYQDSYAAKDSRYYNYDFYVAADETAVLLDADGTVEGDIIERISELF